MLFSAPPSPDADVTTWPLGGDELCVFFLPFPDLIPPEQRSGMGTSSQLFMRSRPPPMKCELSASSEGRMVVGGGRLMKSSRRSVAVMDVSITLEVIHVLAHMQISLSHHTHSFTHKHTHLQCELGHCPLRFPLAVCVRAKGNVDRVAVILTSWESCHAWTLQWSVARGALEGSCHINESTVCVSVPVLKIIIIINSFSISKRQVISALQGLNQP